VDGQFWRQKGAEVVFFSEQKRKIHGGDLVAEVFHVEKITRYWYRVYAMPVSHSLDTGIELIFQCSFLAGLI